MSDETRPMSEERWQGIIYSMADDPFVVKQQRRELIAEVRTLRTQLAEQKQDTADVYADYQDAVQKLIAAEKELEKLRAVVNLCCHNELAKPAPPAGEGGGNRG